MLSRVTESGQNSLEIITAQGRFERLPAQSLKKRQQVLLPTASWLDSSNELSPHVHKILHVSQ